MQKEALFAALALALLVAAAAACTRLEAFAEAGATRDEELLKIRRDESRARLLFNRLRGTLRTAGPSSG
mgnify:CR=1 FL=1